MEARELRIGSIVDWHGEKAIISQILEHEVVFKCGESDLIEHVNPFTITEELLLKLGFEKYRCLGEERYFHENMKLIFVCAVGSKKPSIIIDGLGEAIIISIDNLIYLHQLQNLYFAITGKELETNGL